ncbi:unnamed protein product [Linum tenue]|uniref:Receptor-like serine/threonine-protein kinase n=1 Tax=Linum tenue TaxID=586396 RepID=A0AAV0PAY5_9ROSI|nr:unnamed protein product [Linum tenue]
MELQPILLLLQLITFITLPFSSSSTDTISINQSLADGQMLVSSGERHTLGFFSPGNSTNRYLGIWFTKLPDQIVVWVANRDNPINDTSGLLSIDPQGGMLLHSKSTAALFWSTNVSVLGTPLARLLDEGNFVLLQQDGADETVLWQSFDYPTDTVLPNMVRKTGPDHAVRSWKSSNDPATGDCYYVLDPRGSPELILYRGRATKLWRSGPWNGIAWSGIPEMARITFFNATVVIDGSDTTFVWGLRNPDMIARFYLDPTGTLNRAVWQDKVGRWNLIAYYPKEQCDYYGNCGPNGNCDPYRVAGDFPCTCLPGFEPRFPNDWYLRDGSGGCVRKRTGNLSCGGDGFVKLENAKVPDTTMARLNVDMDLDVCGEECLKNCSCTAYASSNLASGVGCVTLYGDLVDTRVFAGDGQDLYVRVDATELGMRARMREILYEDKDSSVPIFDVNDIFDATGNFSLGNKLGQGGFGSVYKGVLFDGQEIAVKRLSQTSRQGIEEFKNEVRLVSKLQHKNLARLFGCCIHGDEKMLVYEYLQNRSLDFFIFDKTQGLQLDWPRRFEIIIGIARGLLYLHQDSRLKIIHRDLKASNVLLDAAMNPKISDFGLARLFGEDQTEANTNRVVGTYGYMSPEYAMGGLYSTKSDAFSFGVLTLEILSGRRSNQCHQESPSISLIAHVWELWKEGRAMDIVDSSTLGGSDSTDQVMTRCVQIGLLCVQESPVDRPTMSDVVFMLGNATTLPSPKKPAFILQGKYDDMDTIATGSSAIPSTNRVTLSTLVPR